MNQLTIIFFEKLSAELRDEGPLRDRLKREMINDGRKRLQECLQESTLFLSAKGQEFSKRMRQWFQDVHHLTEIRAAEPLLKRLNRLCAEVDDMRRDTQQAIASPGRLDPEQVHILPGAEHAAATQRLYDALCIEMFRLMAAGGGGKINALPPLQYVHPTVQGYYQYYAQHVCPALEMLDRRKRYGMWAFQFREQARMGLMAKLPAYVQIAPKAERTPLLPGEYHVLSASTGGVWQGMGVLTNVTPQTVARAQAEGVHDTVTPAMLSRVRMNDSPSQILDQCFPGGFYAVDPAHFFSVLSIARASRSLLLRQGNNQCLYCGVDGAGGSLCLSCLGKVRQKI